MMAAAAGAAAAVGCAAVCSGAAADVGLRVFEDRAVALDNHIPERESSSSNGKESTTCKHTQYKKVRCPTLHAP